MISAKLIAVLFASTPLPEERRSKHEEKSVI
jgi:hypothetical protein